MYEQQFGLKKRPFPAKATGNEVFVGPQTAKTMAGLKKALTSQDAVVAVSGPAGAGKTTLVAKALNALSGTHTTVRIGRMQLEGTDALEFLLEELGTTTLPKGPIRQFTALRETLNQFEADGKQVVIVVEDAARAGAETLAELEALTAADAGDSGGAAIILMGNHTLLEFLKDPQLARLEQRVRQRHSIKALCAAELRAYLMHCFRLAGTDFEQVFDTRSADLVHQLSGGIPRVANKLVESAVTSAAAAGLDRIPASFVADMAKEEFGLEASDFDATPVAAGPEPVVDLEPISEPEPEPEPQQFAEIPGPEAVEQPSPGPDHAQDPVIVFSDEVSDKHGVDDIPELIQDTLPDLEILAPEFMAVESEPELPELQPEPQPVPEPALAIESEPELPELQPEPEPIPEPLLEAEPEPVPEPVLEPQPEPVPVAEPALRAEPEPVPEPVLEAEPEPVPVLEPQPEPVLEVQTEPASAAKDVPAWERDPTIAELRPDLDALEKAMAFAHGDVADEPEPVVAVPEAKASKVKEDLDEIPEITLDNAIQSRIEDHLIDEPGQISPNAPEAPAGSASSSDIPEVRIAPRKAKKADAELERIASELAKAKTIEDVDDKLAETLFGEELSFIASQVVANPPSSNESANDDELALFDTATSQMAQAAGSTEAIEVSLETRDHSGEAGLDLSASQRLKTVRALNADLHPSLREPAEKKPNSAPDSPPSPVQTPDPIEDQINISMTQTLKALKIKPPISERARPTSSPVEDEDEDEDEEQNKGGFFSRFKRS